MSGRNEPHQGCDMSVDALGAQVTEPVLVERHGTVGIVRLNDPGSLNALSIAMVEALGAAVEELAGTARVIVLAATGRGFCAGAGLDGVKLGEGEQEAPDLGAFLEDHLNPLMRRLRDLPVPWITSVRGPAAGGGCALALAADLVLASDTAYFLQSFSRIGLIPDGGSAYLLSRAAGRVRAMEMMLLGERIPAARALEWGLINRVVPDAELDAATLALAEGLARGPTLALGLTRKALWRALDSDWDGALDLERHVQSEAGRSRDAREGIRAFLEKRKPDFSGR